MKTSHGPAQREAVEKFEIDRRVHCSSPSANGSVFRHTFKTCVSVLLSSIRLGGWGGGSWGWVGGGCCQFWSVSLRSTAFWVFSFLSFFVERFNVDI